MEMILDLELKGEMLQCDVCGRNVRGSDKEHRVYVHNFYSDKDVNEIQCADCHRQGRHELT